MDCDVALASGLTMRQHLFGLALQGILAGDKTIEAAKACEKADLIAFTALESRFLEKPDEDDEDDEGEDE